MPDLKSLPVDSFYPGTDVYVSRVTKLDVLRLEARRDILQDRKDNYTDGLSPKGETILSGCIAALEGLK